ncbi:MAG: HD domain-containing protein [Candidatus Paceibacterota bacterium]
MKNIIEIYKEYKIMPILVMHQVRVAAVAIQISKSLNDKKINEDSILKACLLHDMGNIIKFDLDHFSDWNKPEGTEYWQKIKNEYIEKYGKNEHKATLLIGKEIGISSRILELIDSIDSSVAKNIVEGDDFEKKICMYADNRVSPHGIVSAEEHSLDAKERYKNHPNVFNEESRVSFMKNLFIIEKQIFSNSNIKPEEINDESIKNYLEELKNYNF